MIFNDLWPVFEGHDIFEAEHLKNRRDLGTMLL